jgi:hypothetical protein
MIRLPYRIFNRAIETVFDGYDEDRYYHEVSVRDEYRTRYAFCEDLREYDVLFRREECHNCGQRHWPACGQVIDVDVPGHVEEDQQTLDEIGY